ncbi:MAG: hypothetical protein DMG17_28350, partial [Acidobacteria bacterium]
HGIQLWMPWSFRESFNLSCAASETIRSPTRSSHIHAVRESENAFWRFLFFRVFDIGDASLLPAGKAKARN